MSAKGRYYSQPYARLDDDPSTWSADISSDAEPYDPTISSAAMPLEPYPHYQADYANPLNDYAAQLPTYPSSARGGNSPARSTPRGSPSRHERAQSRDSRPTYDNRTAYDSRPSYNTRPTHDTRHTSYSHDCTDSNNDRNTPRYTNTRSPSSHHSDFEDFEALKHRSRPAQSTRTWPWTHWSRKRKWVFFGGSAAFLIILIIIIAAAVAVSSRSYNYTPSYASVTNAEAFTSGGATRNSVNDTQDGIGAGVDIYTYYQGDETNFPTVDQWISFEDMWNNNLPLLQSSCSALGEGADNSDAINQDIYNAIQSRANASLVDHRFILATILQESNGCVRVGGTTSSGGVTNPGLMQSHNGVSFDSSFPSQSIMQMVQDGTQGTEHGAGLVQNLNRYGNVYKAARGYNSGYIPKSGDLSLAAGATACYVTDIANRLTGWTNAKSTCPGDAV